MPELPPPTPTELVALDRTVLANERTLLSYIRTGVMLTFGGVSFVELLPISPLHDVLRDDAMFACAIGSEHMAACSRSRTASHASSRT
ncbi:MAG: DUF202 domain-containing protein [Myxococcota bacterium]